MQSGKLDEIEERDEEGEGKAELTRHAGAQQLLKVPNIKVKINGDTELL